MTRGRRLTRGSTTSLVDLDAVARPLDRLRLWLAPGMGVKRHVVLAVAGTLVSTVGVAAFVLWFPSEARAALSAPVEEVAVSDAWRRWGGIASIGLVGVGLALGVLAVQRLNRSLLSHWLPEPKQAAHRVHRKLTLSRGPRIVAVGGGTGLSNLLRGLRHGTRNLTAVVTVADDGGSSGRLRAAFDMPAPGDLSDCLAALSDYEGDLGRLMQYRFERGEELRGHTFGNLLITTLNEVEGDVGRAVRVLNRILNLEGHVWPATTHLVSLEATKTDGVRVRGESSLAATPGAITTLDLVPADAPTLPEVRDAIAEADLVVLGPGSLFSSVIAALLVPDIRSALASTAAPIVYVANIMTEAGETDGMDVVDHLSAVERHLGRRPDLVLVNDAEVDASRQAAYRDEAADPVEVDVAALRATNVAVVAAPLLGIGPHAQHDPLALAQALLDLARATRRRRT